METQDILKKVRQIEIKTKGLTQHLFSGAYHSTFKGRGMSFSEVREYQFGDDIRHIDWNVTARSGQTQIKVFEEERELTLMLLVDISRSTNFGSLDQTKSQWMTELCAVLAFSATQNHDKVGMILFSDKIHLYIPPKKGKLHILRMIRELLVQRSDAGKTRYDLPLQYLNRVQTKKTICFLISDFNHPVNEPSLKIVSRRHDVIGLQMLDPLEKNWVNVGLIQLQDSENGKEILFDSSDKTWVKQISENQKNHNLKLKQVFNRANADLLHLDLNESYIKNLLNFFKKRH
ncbi:MAG: DUF58 domain-containing protein [Saprospiraceae bacterium]